MKLFLCIVFMPAITLGLLTGCGGGDPEPTQPEPSASDGGQSTSASAQVTDPGDTTVAEKTGAVRNLLKEAAARATNELETEPNQPAIQIPDRFSDLSSALNAAGEGDLLKNFSKSLDTAGKELAGKAIPVLGNIIGDFPISGVDQIVDGGPTAATDYLKATSRKTLVNRLTPLAEEAIRLSGTEAYVDRIEAALGGGGSDSDSVMGGLKQMTGIKLPGDFDLPTYVAAQTTDALFTALARGEQTIRQNPDLLKKITDGVIN
ncbi:MAG: DUF4197 family protein [Opitutales bacterium]